MLTTDWQYMLKSRKYSDKEEELEVSPKQYLEFKKYMEEQDKDDNIHILSMNYTIQSGKLIIKRRYFR